MRFITSILIILFGLSSPCLLAQTKTEQKLKTIQTQLKTEKEKQKKLEQEKLSVQTQIQDTQRKTIKLAETLQDQESQLNDLTQQVSRLNTQQDSLARGIEEERRSIITLMEILQRIAMEPPSLILMQQQTYGMDQMNTALLAQGTAEIATGKIKHFATQRDQLQRVQQETEIRTKEAQKVAQTVKAQKLQMDTLLEQKKKSEEKLSLEAQKTQEKIKKLAKESKDLADLMKKLMAQKKGVAGKAPTVKSKIPGPVRGRKVIQFGQKNTGGITAKGLTIDAASKASVITPYNGRVLFSGPFKKYDNLMIIEHPKGFHSVIAGIASSFVKEGQSVLAGEPLGHLGTDGQAYIELRYQNTPVNPEDYFIIKN